MRFSTFVVFASLVAAPRVPAQTPATSLPSELVTALFSGGSFAAPSTRYYVGVVPPSWPAELMPASPMAVSGGMLTGTRLSAVFVDSSAHRPVEIVRRQLEAAGWTQPPREPVQGFEARGGFQSSDPRYTFWCRDSVRATIAPAAIGSALTYVRVSLESMRGQPCAPDPSRQRSMIRQPLTLPPLLPPPGVRSTSGGSSSGGTSINVYTQLADSTMSATAILAHYTAQLVKAGWTTYPPTTTTAFALQPLETRDKDGTPWYGILTVMPSAKVRDVAITMTRPEAP